MGDKDDPPLNSKNEIKNFLINKLVKNERQETIFHGMKVTTAAGSIISKVFSTGTGGTI